MHLSWLLRSLLTPDLGTIFLLAIIAVAQLRSYVRHKQISHDVVMKINHLLRSPKSGRSSSFWPLHLLIIV